MYIRQFLVSCTVAQAAVTNPAVLDHSGHMGERQRNPCSRALLLKPLFRCVIVSHQRFSLDKSGPHGATGVQLAGAEPPRYIGDGEV